MLRKTSLPEIPGSKRSVWEPLGGEMGWGTGRPQTNVSLSTLTNYDLSQINKHFMRVYFGSKTSLVFLFAISFCKL